MVKVFITGNAGSGKTTLAARLGTELGVPVYGLDSIVWRPGWKKASAQERDAAIAALVKKPAWIIDGVAPAVLSAADIVIFLDLPRHRCILRCAKRNWRYLLSSRPGLPEDCPEIRIIGRLLQIIWRFPSRVRPGILAAIAAHSGSTYVAAMDAQADVVRGLIVDRDMKAQPVR